LQLKPIDPTNLSSFASSSLYNLKELIVGLDPVILGAMPEQTIYVYALEIQDSITNLGNLTDVAKYLVHALEFAGPLKLANTSAKVITAQTLVPVVARVIEIGVVLPNMGILQTSLNYSRNGLGLGLSVKVSDPTGGETKPGMPFPVWLPMPYLGVKVEWDAQRNSVGFRELGSRSRPAQGIDFLGKKSVPKDTHLIPTTEELVRWTDAPGGQLRWYSLNQENVNFKTMLGIGSAGTLNPYPEAPQAQLSLALPVSAASKLAGLRRAGRWLYNECEIWTDDNFFVTLPKEPGYLVAWRDDLPSRPIQCLEAEQYLCDLVISLAKKLWGTAGAHSSQTIKIPVPVGQMITLAVQRLQDAANNELIHLLGNSGIHVRFAFLTTPYADAQHPASQFDPAGFNLPDGEDASLLQSVGSTLNGLVFKDSFEPGKGGQNIYLRYRPPVVQEGAADPAWSAFAVQLQVSLSGKFVFHGVEIDLNGLPPMAVGPQLIFVPKPLRIPTLAVFFSDINFQGVPLVMLPANSGLFQPDIHFDANSSGDLNQVRNTVVSKLNDIFNMLKLAQAFWKSESFNLIVNILGCVASAGRLVVNTTGKIENLSDCIVEKHWYGDSHFNDAISSMVLIGPPHAFTHTRIKCYQNSMRRPDLGLCLKLEILPDRFVAAIPFFKNLLGRYTFKNPFPGQPDIVVDLPYAAPSCGPVDFNDAVTGIEFVTEP
jgi:hypothetical protein